MRNDKKRVAAGLRWVLPVARGNGWEVEWDVAAGDDVVRETVKEIASS